MQNEKSPKCGVSSCVGFGGPSTPGHVSGVRNKHEAVHRYRTAPYHKYESAPETLIVNIDVHMYETVLLVVARS